MGYHIAIADASGNRVTASERQLSPGPTRVDYPTEAAGSLLETPDGRVIQQQPLKDNRRRSWIWEGYPGWLVTYQDLWSVLESLLSQYRKNYGAATPYVYVKEDVTGELTRLVTYAGTATAGGATTLTDSSQTWTTNALTGYEVEIVEGTGAGQIRTIASNTGTVLTVTDSWSTNPASGSKYAVRGQVSDWFRVRVIDAHRTPAASDRLNTYEETRVVFVIDDSAFNDLG
jgi:hypothetical protein